MYIMKLHFEIKFLNGFWGLSQNIFLKLAKLTPVYIIIFVAYGDSFLPKPLSTASYKTRTTINNVLLGSFKDKIVDSLENNKYDNKSSDKILEKWDKQGK